MEKIPYVNLGILAKEIMPALLAKTQAVLESGWYILGPEVTKFEEDFARYCGAKYAVGVSNGTSALYLVLKALDLQKDDEVITVPNSFIATVGAIELAGAKAVLVDSSDDLNIDPERIAAAITPKTKAIIPVHLTGRPAKMPAIMELAKKRDLFVLEDSAQAVGAALQGKRAGAWGHASGFSLHPLKNLHAFGDAGVITTNEAWLYEKLRKARNLGFKNRDECEFFSSNERLDELHAGLLNVQMPHLDRWTEERRRLAMRYNGELRALVAVPEEAAGETCVYQTYVVQAPKRDELLTYLVENGVDAKVHYPIPIHLQESSRHLGYKAEDFPTLHRCLGKILSLPCYPGLTTGQQDRVISLIRSFYAR